MKTTLSLLSVLLFAPLAALHAADAPPSPVKTGVILVNHVGFPPNAPKHCVIPAPPKKEFTIHRLKDTKWTQVFAGELVEGGNELEPGSVGDFSSLKEDGTYQVRCGTLKSRAFMIHAGVYDVPMRSLFNYFTWARCGDTTKNCTGPCHLDDGNLVGVGRHDFSGGYHQSSDQRKWPWGLNLGLMGMVQFGNLQKPHWDNGSIAEEIRWGCDYYQKLVRDDGGMFDSVFIPLGAGARDFYPSDPPAPALWNNIRHQAMAAEYFKENRDAAYAAKCRQTAERVWRYITSDKRPKGLYVPPAMPPLGHSGLNVNFSAFYEGSSQDLAHRVGAALALHRATGDKTFLEDAAISTTRLTALQAVEADGSLSGLFWEGTEGDRLGSELRGFGYFGNSTIITSLCGMIAAAPEHPDAPRWREAIRAIAERYRQISARNPWGLLASQFTLHDSAIAKPTLTERPYPGATIRPRTAGTSAKFVAYEYRSHIYHHDIMLAALFLNRAAEITGDDSYRVLAQRQLDWVMGCNPFDASAIEGVGYNQPLRGLFGEFFPATPQISGAVGIRLSLRSFDPNQYGNCGSNEYDMPVVGNVLWVMAEQAKQPGK